MSLVGRHAPGFSLPSTKNMDFLDERVSLEDHRGRWVVLVFYPADFTFVCPTEVLAFSASAEEFAAEDADVIAISPDGVHCHQAWQEFVLGPLAFPLASDSTLAVSRAYDVLVEEDGVPLRALFLIDPHGVVRYEVVHDDNVGRSVQESLRVLRGLKMGTRVPAGWQPGDPTLEPAA